MHRHVTGIHARAERGKPRYAVHDRLPIDDNSRRGNHLIPLRQFEMALDVAFDDDDIGPRGGQLADRLPRRRRCYAVFAVKDFENVKHDEQHSGAESALL